MTVWGYLVFLNAADLVMILRVYAMWNRSKTILGVLFFIYVLQIITSFVFGDIYFDPNTYLSAKITGVKNISFCIIVLNLLIWYGLFVKIPRFTLSAALFVFALVPTVRQSILMYKAAKQWQPNRYMQLFVRDGTIYFVMNLIINVTDLISNNGTKDNNSARILLFGLTAAYTMMPRFIIRVRELYDWELRRFKQGIDTGFGMGSQPVDGESHATVSTMAFAFGQDRSLETDADASEGIELEAR